MGKPPYSVRMWGLSREQRDVLLALSREWDSFYEDSTEPLKKTEPPTVAFHPLGYFIDRCTNCTHPHANGQCTVCGCDDYGRTQQQKPSSRK